LFLGIGQDRRQFADVPRPGAYHDVELGHQTTQCIDQHRAASSASHGPCVSPLLPAALRLISI
jgi:hypothetical protein